MKVKLQSFSAVCFAGLLVLTTFQTMALDTKDLVGAWGYGPATNRTVRIHTDKVFTVSTYDHTGKKFISSYGGTWRVAGNKLTEKIEWNSKDKEQVGKEFTHDVRISSGKLNIAQKNETLDRIDDGKPGALMGAWVITGNYVNDKVTKRAAPFYPRRTMKVLSGTHFQWIAYNVETKEFTNAGGGTYTTIDGKYTESIEFFTKTPESIGKILPFQYSFVDGDWRHKGEKSTGGPMDECWSRRETLER